MSFLRRLLMGSASRPTLKDQGKPGYKRPLIYRNSYPEALTDFCVSATSGDLMYRSGNGDVIAAFFELPPKEESLYAIMLIYQLWVLCVDQSWSNIQSKSEFDGEELAQGCDYLMSSGLDWGFSIAPEAYVKTLISEGRVEHPETRDVLGDEVDLKNLQNKYGFVGWCGKRTLSYHDMLVDIVGCFAPPEYVGSYQRIQNHIAVILHNAERAVWLCRLSEET